MHKSVHPYRLRNAVLAVIKVCVGHLNHAELRSTLIVPEFKT